MIETCNTRLKRIAFLSFIIASNSQAIELAAFRGMHQPPHADLKIESDTCTADPIAYVNHRYLENTIAGIRASFAEGATIGHFNVHRTKDGKAVVFHDWSVDCRTNGTGQTNRLSFAYLRSLDIGFGYTKYDQAGRAYFPFRGQTEPMPTPSEILQAIPDRDFLVYIKDNSSELVYALAADLRRVDTKEHRRIIFIGEQIALVKKLLPQLRIFNSRSRMETCGKWYLSVGWTGYIHPSCYNTNIIAPVSVFRKFSDGARRRLFVT